MSNTTADQRRRAEGKRNHYVNTGEASEMLGGLLSAQQIRLMCLAGEVPGALKVRQRVLLPIRSVERLVVDLEFSARPQPIRKRQPSTFDQTSRVG